MLATTKLDWSQAAFRQALDQVEVEIRNVNCHRGMEKGHRQLAAALGASSCKRFVIFTFSAMTSYLLEFRKLPVRSAPTRTFF